VFEKAWGLVPPAIWCLHKYKELQVGASYGSSDRLIRCLQKEGVRASKQSKGVGASCEWWLKNRLK